MVTFEILAKDGAGRVGRLTTAHGAVTTPALLPVVNPNRPLITPRELRSVFGAEILITNSYILRRTPELAAEVRRLGVHRLLDWDGPIMTDSGTFQSYVYGGVSVEPQEIIAFQRDIGVDIGTILDLFTVPDATHAEAESDLTETLIRARAAADIKGEMALAATVQGGIYPDLREKMATSYASIAADVHPIGGVVPLMEGQRYGTLAEVIVAAKRALDPSRPVHLFGAGHPHVFALAALLGCDLFDSAAYAKFAKEDRMIFPTGTRHLADITDLACPCPVCSTHQAGELRAASPAVRERLLAEHNLYVSFAEIRQVRQALREGTLWELVAQRCRAHPTLLDGLRHALANNRWIESLEPISKPSAFFYSGSDSLDRPEVLRARERLRDRFVPRGDIELYEAGRPYSVRLGPHMDAIRARPAEPCVATIFGVVPLVLDETYPFAQCVEPDAIDADASARAWASAEEQARHWGVRLRKQALHEPAPAAPATALPSTSPAWDERRIAALCDWQFGPGAAKALLGEGTIRLRKSPSTGRVRNVFVDDAHILSLRASDGLFTLKLAGARRLHQCLPRPTMRVVVDPDTASFAREGKNVFAKFVRAVDPGLRAKDESLVVTPDDEFLAVAQLVLAPSEATRMKAGVAASVREGAAAPAHKAGRGEADDDEDV
ncbi:MAG: tRNA guanosine(15) transglycosylase TgtA [Thermoplasmatota archaeon]